MPIDMKEQIANSAWHLLLDKKAKRLTVKDIVEDCKITRQTFYYHFEDIPSLFRWIIERHGKSVLQESLANGDAEQCLKTFFLLAINASPYVKQGMETNYRQELQQMLLEYCGLFFTELAEHEKIYPNCSRKETEFLVRYHSYAVIGVLHDWSEEDTKNLDEIVHRVWLLIKSAPAEDAAN